MQLNKLQAEMKAEKEKLKKIYVLSQNVDSGADITIDLLKEVTASSSTIPSNAISMDYFSEKEIDEVKVIAKINLEAGTILTEDMVRDSENPTTDDLRIQEYNMITLPSQLATGQYIDIRLMLPTGEDYLVISKKKVEIPVVEGIDSDTTIWLNMSEADTLVMSNAIVEAYIMTGSNLYATVYVEPGMQNAITPTYIPKEEITRLITKDPNIEQVAKNALINRYNSDVNPNLNGGSSIRYNSINPIINSYNENDEAKSNVETKVQEQIKKAAELRKSYLESLGE